MAILLARLYPKLSTTAIINNNVTDLQRHRLRKPAKLIFIDKKNKLRCNLRFDF
ncbi:hypothetical protein l11_12300 [Neisseria weaveri LMG 5135]|nr:hypothetical protein l11_12300 [Neisseria weaveri LMG 5135]